MRQIMLPGSQSGKETCALDANTSHYLVSVRRMHVGDSFEAMDETGARFACTLLSDEPRGAKLALVLVSSPEPPAHDSQRIDDERRLRIALVQALPKGQKFDLIIRQAVELGVELIVPVITRYCVGIDPSDRTALKLERRRRIIREALQQSGSAVHTEIVAAERLESLDAQLSSKGFDRDHAVRILFHESAQKAPRPLHTLLSGARNRIVIGIGPEGGFSEEDCAAFSRMGFAVHHAAGPVLRVETAAIFAVSAVRAIGSERDIWKA
jgi:16S rRNA (uracil1498-N3)-methyltransferase